MAEFLGGLTPIDIAVTDLKIPLAAGKIDIAEIIGRKESDVDGGGDGGDPGCRGDERFPHCNAARGEDKPERQRREKMAKANVDVLAHERQGPDASAEENGKLGVSG